MSAEVITTVVTPATATPPAGPYDLATLATVKIELGISGTQNDTQLSRYISAASLAIAQFCNRVLVPETVADRFDMKPARLQFGGEKALQSSRWPIISITSLLEGGIALIKDTDYMADQASGAFWRLNTSGNPMTWGVSPVVATYSAGYADAADLTVLEDAAIRMVRARWDAKDRDPFLKSEDIPGVRTASWWVATGAEAGNMTPDVVDLLENYRTPTVA